MFGYIIIDQGNLKFKEYDIYRSYYCGLCRKLKDKYGVAGQATLSYDMTFIVMLLTGLYEPEVKLGSSKCIAHPFEKHATRIDKFTEYAADMNLILTYYKCKDDWTDDKKYSKLLFSKLLESKNKKIQDHYTEKIEKIASSMKELDAGEKEKETNIDLMAGRFGEIMAQILVYKSDEWEVNLYKLGFFLGKFIYLMDAYEDIEEDLKSGSYNPLYQLYETSEFEEKCKRILTMMMAECSKEFEKLPILDNVEILRNILYSGVWARYEQVREKRREKGEQKNA